jgi:hypothetical protein
MLINGYAIRHIKSRQLMPECKRRGYSHWNPDTNSLPDNITGMPRILKSRKQAKQCIAQWNAVPNAREKFYTNSYGETDVELDYKPDGRKKEDLEVIEVCIKIKGPNDPYWTDWQ